MSLFEIPKEPFEEDYRKVWRTIDLNGMHIQKHSKYDWWHIYYPDHSYKEAVRTLREAKKIVKDIF